MDRPPPIPTTLPVRNTFRPRLPPGRWCVWGGRWGLQEGTSVRNWKPDPPLRAPAARHRDCSNTASGFDVGLTAKFVLRKSVGFSFTSPTGEAARSGRTGGENSDAERRRGGSKRSASRRLLIGPLHPSSR